MSKRAKRAARVPQDSRGVTEGVARNADTAQPVATVSVAKPKTTPQGLILGVWHDLTTYGCPHCPFDSLRERTTLDHVAKTHMRIRNSQIRGPSGNPVQIIEEVE